VYSYSSVSSYIYTPSLHDALPISLRGMAGGNFSVQVLDEGVHSGDASGIVPSSFRLLRQLLSRIEDEATGQVLVDGLHADIPARSEEHTSELQSRENLVCRLLLEK